MNKNKNKTLFKMLKDKHHNNQLITPCARYQGDFSGRYCLLPGRILRASVPDLACPPTKASSVYCSCQDWKKTVLFSPHYILFSYKPSMALLQRITPDLPLGSTAQVEPPQLSHQTLRLPVAPHAYLGFYSRAFLWPPLGIVYTCLLLPYYVKKTIPA